MLKLERTVLKCDKVGCDKTPSFKVCVYSSAFPEALPSVYCPEHSMEAVANFEKLCKDDKVAYEVSA